LAGEGLEPPTLQARSDDAGHHNEGSIRYGE
jgi:hypothetical protein